MQDIFITENKYFKQMGLFPIFFFLITSSSAICSDSSQIIVDSLRKLYLDLHIFNDNV